MDGWIKISRKMLEWEWSDNPIMVSVWLHILMLANHKDRTYRGVMVLRGQLAISIRRLADICGISFKQCRTCLERLEENNAITRNTRRKSSAETGQTEDTKNGKQNGKRKANGRANNLTLITICNYDSYQFIETPQGQTDGQTNGNPLGNQTANEGATIQEYKKERIEEDNLGVNNLTPSSSESDAAEPPVVVDLKKSEKKPIDFKALADFFNNYMKDAAIPQIKMISPKRQQAVSARAGEYGMDAVYTVIDKASKSIFLNGGGKKHFVASFDWMFGPMNFPKVLEGNYDNQTFENNNNHGNNGQFIDPQQARLEQYERNIKEYVAGQLASLANEG
jgi:hypothetical protein